ncbi:MAG: metallophosphoesterase [candidate division WOR-3 bacterium]|nr:metallophosphoesterase [candidate division WOR-3 bacterium]MCX7836783.1 metallophosphoesterase [candidate division WOR-3 bacterium]MDW8113579.1 metallophosphoesterase [candidate division WOR-3 bacterium]
MKIFVLISLFSFTLLFPFSFVVLGDRTGGAKDEIFKQIIEEIKILKPNFVITTGDLIEGNKKDSLAIIKEWEKVLKMLKETDTKIYFTPGNHDIYSELSEKIYLSLIGKTYYSFSYENAHFIVIDNSRYNSYYQMPKNMIDWLERDLQLHKKYRWKFVFMHRPFWRYEYEKNKLKDFPLHQIFKKYQVNYVFSGHDHFYAYLFYDSIHYFQVGPSGSRYKIYFDEKEGAFQNYLFCKVEKNQVSIAVIKPGSIFPKEKIILEEIISKERFKKEGISLTPLIISEEKEEDTITLYLTNPLNKKLRGNFLWQFSSEDYLFDTEKGSFVLEEKGKGSYSFIVKIRKPQQIYPLPKIYLFINNEDKKDSLTFILPIKKEIKLKDGEFYQLEEFGKEDGTKAPLKNKIIISYDKPNLYLNYSSEETYQLDSLFFYFAKNKDSILEVKVTKEEKFIFSQIRVFQNEIKRFQQRKKEGKGEIKIGLEEIFSNDYIYFNIKLHKENEIFYLKVPFDFNIEDWYKIDFIDK